MGMNEPRRPIAVAILLTVFLGGCATSYKALGRGTGYSEEKMSEESYLVSFKGNRYTDGQTVGKYLLYRCAELSSSLGYEHFAIVSRDEKIHSFMIGKGVGRGGVGFRHVKAPPVEMKKVTRSAVIVLSHEPVDEKGAEVYVAREILAELRPEVLPGR